MQKIENNKTQIDIDGFTIIEDVFSDDQIKVILQVISDIANTNNPAFRKTNELFAIRSFLKEVPQIIPFVFTRRLKEIIQQLFGLNYFIVKSIYFDKPAGSNWFVPYHQDLTISVNAKADLEGFGPWTIKQSQYAVQAPLQILEDNFTVRIHLDYTDENNGALKVIPGSHLKGIYRQDTTASLREEEVSCRVNKGGIMIMRPLLLHASGRTTNAKNRRVIHIEFSKCPLPKPLQWSEKLILLN